jgi:hypothetical protein
MRATYTDMAAMDKMREIIGEQSHGLSSRPGPGVDKVKLFAIQTTKNQGNSGFMKPQSRGVLDVWNRSFPYLEKVKNGIFFVVLGCPGKSLFGY